MLILTRRIGETLKIGDDVSLMVLGVQGNQVRIGADAPKHIAIHREEIYRRIQQEKQNGGQPVPPKPAKSQTSSSQNHTPRNTYNDQNSHNSIGNSYNSYNSYNTPSGNRAQNSHGNHDKPYKNRDDFNKPYNNRQDYGNQQEASTENTRFYSTEGNTPNKAQKKAPNVIVKKKRVIEGL